MVKALAVGYPISGFRYPCNFSNDSQITEVSMIVERLQGFPLKGAAALAESLEPEFSLCPYTKLLKI
jgi:hypothetical protein